MEYKISRHCSLCDGNCNAAPLTSETESGDVYEKIAAGVGDNYAVVAGGVS
jgi:hypothetical protein